MRNANRCGLCVIDVKRKKIVVLRRKCPYNTRPTARGPFKRYPFLEQFCIPRGCQNAYEAAFSCGIREFIEECGFFFKSFYKLSQTFDLEWEDPKDVIWSYKISFIFVNLDTIFVPFETKISELVSYVTNECQFEEGALTIKSEILQSLQDELNTENLKLNFNQSIVPIRSKPFLRIQNREFVEAVIMDIAKYFELINVQKKFYEKNNYTKFINLIDKAILPKQSL